MFETDRKSPLTDIKDGIGQGLQELVRPLDENLGLGGLGDIAQREDHAASRLSAMGVEPPGDLRFGLLEGRQLREDWQPVVDQLMRSAAMGVRISPDEASRGMEAASALRSKES